MRRAWFKERFTSLSLPKDADDGELIHTHFHQAHYVVIQLTARHSDEL